MTDEHGSPEAGGNELPHQNLFNVTLQNDDIQEAEMKDNIVEFNTSVLELAKQKLQALLLDDFEEHSIERLEFLLASIESGIRGENILISEDIIEFTTYLTNSSSSDSESSSLSQQAIDSFIQRFDNKFETISKIGQLRRPQIGDLLIDAFCDLVIIICAEINDFNNHHLQEHCMAIIKLISITCKVCVLRHGFTRLFEMYNWLLSRSKPPTTKDSLSPSNSYPSSPNATKYKPSSFNMSLANTFLDILTNCIRLNGPEIYLSSSSSSTSTSTSTVNGGGLRPMVHIKSRLSKGWSFTSWIRLHNDQTNGATSNILSFEGLLRISLEILVIPHITCVLKIETIEKHSKFYMLPDLNLSPGRWHYICFSHNISTKQDNFIVFLDGKCIEQKLSVSYPNFSTINNNGIFPLHIGGFYGDIGQSFIYETSLNNLTVSALYCVGATYNPPIYNRSGTTNNYFDRIAAFPRSVRQRAAPMQPRKYGYLLLPFCYGLNPRAVSEVLSLPYGWGYIDICDRKDNLHIVSIPHNKSSLISMGGICYIFYWLSPEFNGPNIYSDTQAMNILTFINELITNNLTLLRQLFTMGLSAIKIYILRYIKYQHRTHLILNCIKELLMIVTNCDQDSRKQYFIDGFVSIILDTNYWIKSPQNVQNMVAQYIHTLIQTQPKIMANCLSLTQIFDMLRAFYPQSFSFDINDTTKVPNATDSRHVAYKLLESAAALARLKPSTIKYSSHRSISLLISQCVAKAKDLRCQILSTYAEMCHNAPDIMFTQMAQKPAFIKVLWDILQESDAETDHISNQILTDTRVKTAKILMAFIGNQRKVYSSITSPTPVVVSVVTRSGHVHRSALDELIFEIGVSLGSLPPSLASYASLLDIVLGKFKLNMPSHSNAITSYIQQHINSNKEDNAKQTEPEQSNPVPSFSRNKSLNMNMIPLVSDKDQINLVGALGGLMNLISVSAYRIRTRMLMDILSLVKTSDYNQKLLCRQRNSWDKWMVNLISLEADNDDSSACNQLVSQIAATIVWRFLIKDDKGWISVMQLLESLNRRILNLIRAEKQIEIQQSQQQTNGHGHGHEEEHKQTAQPHKISTATKLKCRVLHEFLVQVLVLVLNRFLMDQLRSDHGPKGGIIKRSNMNDLSDASENIKSRTSKNLISILDITEWVLFNHRFSMLSIPRIRLKQDAKESDITAEMLFDTPDSDIDYEPEQIRNEILLLKRLLSCSLKFISFKNERQLVLRRLLRYLKEILPHKGCHLVFDDVVNAAREFCNRLQTVSKQKGKNKPKISIKSENNMKTMRIAYSFLKNAYLRYTRRGDDTSDNKAKKIRALQEEVYAFWGPLLFEDKIDPNTANQMSLPLISAEESLENGQHHIHSLWVFLQHQKWWEYQFQDKNMKKFKIEYSNHEKEEKKKKLSNKEQFDKYYNSCTHSFSQVHHAEIARITDLSNTKRKNKRDNVRDLKKYMDFFDEDFQCRFPNADTPDFWELDPRESANNHTRLLLVRNFKGSKHLHAAVNNGTRKRGVSRPGSARKRNSGSKKQWSQLSQGLLKDLKLHDGFPQQSPNAMQPHMSVESIPEEKEKLMSEDEEVEQEEQSMSEEELDEEYVETNEKYQSANLSGKKILSSLDATSISPFFKISGKMYVTEHHLIFEGHEYIENVHEQNAADQIKLTQQRYDREKKTLLMGGSDEYELIKQLESENKQQFEEILAFKDSNVGNNIIEYEIWSLAHIKHLYPRRYLLRENGLEIWIAGTSRSFFFTFKNRKRRGEVISAICKHSPRFIKANANKDLLVNPLKMLKHVGLTEKWQKRKISNFDYLMELNVLAGRSYNDITQYPVFPWVLTDYNGASSGIDLTDDKNYRDLSKPIGALNADRLQTYVQRYQDSLQDTSDSFPAFYYGSHYMSAGIALYYLCRMEPFATLYINLHGGRFEIPDRTFYSINNAWDLSLNNMGDVKELIPEAFYFPEFLRNINKFPLGHRSGADGKEVNDVELPLWANGSPEEFVRIMGEALESDYVSSNLHHWIDLIFGYKQRGDASVTAHNVFFHLTYAGAVDPDTITDPTIKAATEQQIYHFGQTPNILFHHPHPQRVHLTKCYWLCELHLPCKMDTKLDMLHKKEEHEAQRSHSSHSSQQSISLDELINETGIVKNKPFVICEFKLVEQPSHLSIVRSGQCLKIFDTTERILTFELPMLAYLDYAQPAKSTQLRTIIDTAATQIPPDLPIFELMPPDWSESIIYQTFVISSNGLYGITGGYLDCSIKVHWLKDGSTLASVTGLENGHNDIITCLALDHSSQDMLISGAKDGSIVHWSAILKSAKPGRTPLIGKPYRLLSIHYDAVRVIAVNSKVGIIVSAADDATIALYSIARKRFVRELLFEGRGDSTHYNYEVLLIVISDNGYIVIHSIDERIPYLRVLSINGILIRKMKLNEILFSIKIDQSNKMLICGGQACKLTFRYIHNLESIQEMPIIDINASGSYLASNKYKKPASRKAKKNINAQSITDSLLLSPRIDKNKVSHSSAWRQQRYSFVNRGDGAQHSRKGSKSNELFGQRRSMLNNKKKSSKFNHLVSPRISTHFHGRFHSVDGNAILSESRIIDFDLDPDNTFIIVVLLNVSINAVQLLVYPLPNTRHIHQFNKFVYCSNKVLQTAKNTIWENIINVIQSDQSSSTPHHNMKISELYFKNKLDSTQTSLLSHPSSKEKIVETGKNIISKLKKTTNKLSDSSSHHSNNNNNNNQHNNNDNNDSSSINKLGNAFKSFLPWKKQ